MKICVIGAGYVGLVSAVCLAEFGWIVTCVDNDQSRINKLRLGITPIFEPGLDELMAHNINAHRLTFSDDLGSAVPDADVIFLAVGTPMRHSEGNADLSYIYSAIEDLAMHLNGFTVIATKSTVPVGTSREIERRLRGIQPNADFTICANPEFLREGSAIQDFTHPDRILVGVDCSRARKVMDQVYRPLSLRSAPIIFVSRESAELAKYAANAFLAMKISFINEIADLCEQTGANVQEVANVIGKDRRIGDKFLHPGPGYGGSCFPKDVAAIIQTGRENQSPLTLIEQVQTINEKRKLAMAGRIERALGGSVQGMTVAVLGATFKPNTDDMRDAPSLVIIPILQERGALIRIYDPKGRENAEGLLPNVTWCESALDAVSGADVVTVLTEWNEFRSLNLKKVKAMMRGETLVDLRNVFQPRQAKAAGILYFGVGNA